MKAVRLTAPNEISIDDVAEPVPQNGGVVVEPAVMGVCGTDLKVVAGDVAVELPRILGHELVGVVIEAGDGVPVGSRVLVDPAVSCGRCRPCRTGVPNLCTAGGLMGRDTDGVFADLVAVAPGSTILLPDGIDDAAAGLLQVLGTCVHATRDLRIRAGDVAVVIGLGVAGQLIARLLATDGATVVGITRSAEKRARAADHGAAAVASPDTAAATVAEVTGGEGAKVVVEAVGTIPTLAQAVEVAGPGAEVVAFGTITGDGPGLPFYQLYQKEVTLRAPRAALREDYERAVTLVANGDVDASDLVSVWFPLAEIDSALAAASDPTTLKVLLTRR